MTQSSLFAPPARKKAKKVSPGVVFAIVVLLVTLPVLPLGIFNSASMVPSIDDLKQSFSQAGQWFSDLWNGKSNASGKNMTEASAHSKQVSAKVIQVNAKTAPAIVVDGQTLTAEQAQALANGMFLLRSGRLPEAISVLRALELQLPNLVSIKEQLAMAGMMSNNPYMACLELQDALRLNPKNPIDHSNLGTVYQKLGRPNMAEHEFETAMALDPKLIDPALSLGNLYSITGRLADASRVYASAIKANPDCAVLHNNLGATLSTRGLNSEAVDEFQRALAVAPSMASAHYGLGMAFYNLHNYVAAVTEFKQASALDPNLDDAQCKIENTYKQMGMRVGN